MSESRKQVSFKRVEVYEYSLRLCDNPGCRDGLAVAIDTEIRRSCSDSLDEYEKQRPPIRHRDDLKLSRYEREKLLKNYGCSTAELDEAVARAKKAKNPDKAIVKSLLCAAKRGLSFSSSTKVSSSTNGKKLSTNRDPLRNAASDHGGVQRYRKVERRNSADHAQLFREASEVLQFDTSKGALGTGPMPPMLVADKCSLPGSVGSTPIPADIILTRSLSSMPTRQFRTMLGS